jgi:integrase
MAKYIKYYSATYSRSGLIGVEASRTMGVVFKNRPRIREDHEHATSCEPGCAQRWDTKLGPWDGTYWINFVDGEGRRHRQRIGTDRKIAETVLKAKEGAATLKIHVGVSEDDRISFADFADKWMERMAATWTPETLEGRKYIVERTFKPFFRGALRSITAAQVEDFRAERIRAERAPATVNNEVMILKCMLTAAVEWGLLTQNALHNTKTGKPAIKRLKVNETEARYLRAEEIDAVLAAVKSGRSRKRNIYHAFILLALNTGCRRGELMKLTRKHINLAEGTLTFPQTKNGRVRVVALNETALAALRSLPNLLGDAKGDERLFVGFSEDTISRQFALAAKRCGIDDAHFHTTRHTFASHQALAGATPRILAEQLGHADLRMSMRYQHVSDLANKKALVNAVQLGAALEALPPSDRLPRPEVAQAG